jgi:hypothetical protein
MSEEKSSGGGVPRYVSLIGNRGKAQRGRRAGSYHVRAAQLRAYNSNVLIHGISAEVLGIFAHAYGNASRSLRWAQSRKQKELSLTHFGGKNGERFCFEELLYGLDWNEETETTEWRPFKRNQEIRVHGAPLIDNDIYVLIKIIELMKYLGAQGIGKINLLSLIRKLRGHGLDRRNVTREMMQVFTSIGLLSRTTISVTENEVVRLGRERLFDLKPVSSDRGSFADLAAMYSGDVSVHGAARFERTIGQFEMMFEGYALAEILGVMKSPPIERFLAPARTGNMFSIPHPDKANIPLASARVFALLSSYEPYIPSGAKSTEGERAYSLLRTMDASAVASVAGRLAWIGRDRTRFVEQVLNPLAEIYADFVFDANHITSIYKVLYARDELIDEWAVTQNYAAACANQARQT